MLWAIRTCSHNQPTPVSLSQHHISTTFHHPLPQANDFVSASTTAFPTGRGNKRTDEPFKPQNDNKRWVLFFYHIHLASAQKQQVDGFNLSASSILEKLWSIHHSFRIFPAPQCDWGVKTVFVLQFIQMSWTTLCGGQTHSERPPLITPNNPSLSRDATGSTQGQSRNRKWVWCFQQTVCVLTFFFIISI